MESSSALPDDLTRWLAAEGFALTRQRAGAYLYLVDEAGCRWGLSLRATRFDMWSTVVIFEPGTEHHEVFCDLDTHPKGAVDTLWQHLLEIRYDTLLV